MGTGTLVRFALITSLLVLAVLALPRLAEAQQTNYGPMMADTRRMPGDLGAQAGDHIGAYNLVDAQGRVSLEIVNPTPGEPPPVAQVTLPVVVTPTSDWFYYEVVIELHDASSTESIACVAKFHDHVSQRVVTRTASSGASHTGGSTLTLSIFDYQFRTQQVAEDELNISVQCEMHVGDKLYSYSVTRL